MPLRVLVPPGVARCGRPASPGRAVRRGRGGRAVGGSRRPADQRVAGAPAAAVPRAAGRRRRRCTPGSGCWTCSSRSRGAAPPSVPGRLRHRQDRAAAADRQVVRRGRHRLRRLRRARQRDGRRGRGAGRARRPAHRRPAGRPHRGHRQHLEHADDGARGQHLHRRHGRRVLPRHGLRRRRHRRLDVALGRGAARVRLPDRRAAGGGGLPGRPGLGAGRLLRAGRAGRRPSAARTGSVTDHRRGLAAGRRHDRAGHRAHPAVRPVAVDARPRPGLRAALPGGLLDRLVLPGRRRARRLARPPGRPGLGAAAGAGRSACSPRPTGSARWPSSSAPARCPGASGWCCSAAGCCARACCSRARSAANDASCAAAKGAALGRRRARRRRPLPGSWSAPGCPPAALEEVDFGAAAAGAARRPARRRRGRARRAARRVLAGLEELR